MARGGKREGAGRKPKAAAPAPKRKAKPTAPTVLPQHAKPPNTLEHLRPHQWKPGQSGNPKGRTKGARSKLAEAFLADMYADWEANGVVAIAAVRESRPSDYLKVVASILPKQLEVKESTMDEINDDELALAIAAIAAARSVGSVGEGAPH